MKQARASGNKKQLLWLQKQLAKVKEQGPIPTLNHRFGIGQAGNTELIFTLVKKNSDSDAIVTVRYQTGVGGTILNHHQTIHAMGISFRDRVTDDEFQIAEPIAFPRTEEYGSDTILVMEPFDFTPYMTPAKTGKGKAGKNGSK